MTDALKHDREREHEPVTLGSRWYGWGYHATCVEERWEDGVRMVRMVRDLAPDKPGTKKSKPRPHEWIAAWRVYRYCVPSGEDPMNGGKS